MNRAPAIFCLVLQAIWPLAAQSGPARLAILLAHPEAADAGDLLTAEFSRRPDVQLLERTDIDKVYREQALSAQNSDFVKLGQILGADGLLELDAVPSGQETRLSARLMAVKPGVVLLAQSFSWATPKPGARAEIPLTDWAPLFVKQVAPLLPKLQVLDKEAIPLSVLNLRSAAQSAAGMEEERAIKLLTIERLSREPRLFVLERQRLGSLSEEKDLKSDDSAFWNGTYLLDGVLDASGYSAPTITVSARLTPPKGGAPVLIQLSASRSNLPQVADQLAARIMQALQLSPAPVEWKPADEAAQYLTEAQWALKWKLYPQAQGAAESAWELSRHDMESAETRIRSYMLPIESPTNSADAFHQADFIASARENPPTAPEAGYAQRSLELYLQFSRTLDPNELKSDSPWVKLGLEALISASHHLQRFWQASQAQEGLADEAAGLRASARSVADWLASLPSERKTFCFGNRLPTTDEVVHDFGDNLNIFRCELQWGGFWQERPEDTLALYRELMTGPRFPCIHQDLWFRPADRPRLVSWNHASAALEPSLWEAFVRDLNASTNAFLVMEAKALVLADAVSSANAFGPGTGIQETSSPPRTLDAGVAFFDYVLSDFDSIMAANEQLLYLNWHLDRFGPQWGFYGMSILTGAVLPRNHEWDTIWRYYRGANTNTPGGQVSPEDKYNYAPRLLALRQEYTTRNSERLKEFATAEMFEKQKTLLAALGPYDFKTFTVLFTKSDYYGKQQDYSKEQAAQLLPLIEAYKSNIIARASGGSQKEKSKATNDMHWIELILGKKVREILDAPTLAAQVQTFRPKPQAPDSNVPQKPDHILLVKDFHSPSQESREARYFASTSDHSWNEGRLLLGLQGGWWQHPGSQGGQEVATAAVAVFDPQNDSWDIVPYPPQPAAVRPPEYLPNVATTHLIPTMSELLGPPGAPFALFGGQLYLSLNGGFDKYDFHTRQWTTLNLPDIQNARLFVVNQRLFAANGDSISEITGEGQASRLLASTRRRPAQSLLDTVDEFKHPTLFAGPNQSLRVALDRGGVFNWNGTDWRKEFAAPGAADPAGEGMFFRGSLGIWLLGEEGTTTEFCFDNQWRPKGFIRNRPNANARAGPRNPSGRMNLVSGALPHPTDALWVCAAEEPLEFSPGTAFQSNLFFLVDHSAWAGRDGYDTKLVCLRRGLYEPKFVPLKFAVVDGVSSPGGSWLQFVGNRLFINGSGRPGVWTIPLADLPSDLPDDTGR